MNKKKKGAAQSNPAVLATATKDAVSHSRIVAIREIKDSGIIFFTQDITRKVIEMKVNPNVSMTFWFSLQQREVVIDGRVELLSRQENAGKRLIL